jgi:GntR family transcriptional regulator
MSRSSNNAARARAVLRDAIQSGVYARGSRLPSTRELAAQLGINRNTATKIYAELARENLIELPANRPPIVIGDGKPEPGAAFYKRLREALETIFLESQLIGISPADTTKMVNQAAADFFTSYRSPKVFVAECNEVEARAYAQELTIRLDSVVRPILLDQLGQIEPGDIVVTPFFHLNEVRERLNGRTEHLIGLVVSANSSDIARIATTVTTGPVGIVAVNLMAAERLRRLLGFQIDVPMVTASVNQPETLEAMRCKVECVVSTVRADKVKWQRMPDVPYLLVRYQTDERSIEQLRIEIQRLGQVQEVAGVPGDGHVG